LFEITSLRMKNLRLISNTTIWGRK